jgi:hypothetical protein
MVILLILATATVVAGCGPKDYLPPREDRPTVYRICRDGTHIFKHSDGTFRTPWGYVVTEPDEVCEK